MELRTATIQRGGQAAATAKMAYVPPDHDPVLPEELVDVLDPEAGGDLRRLHLRRGRPLAPDRRAPRLRRRADRDRPRPDRRGALAGVLGDRAVAHPLPARRLRRGPRGPARRGRSPRRDRLRLRDVLDAARRVGARLLLRLRGAARHADGPRPEAERASRSSTSGRRSAWRGSFATSARSAAPARSPARSCAAARSRRRASWSTRSRPRSRRPTASAAGIPPSAPSRRSGSPSTASSRRSTARCRSPGASSPSAGASARSRSTRSRTAGSSASWPTAPRGCVCPPEIPVCVCGREPEAELVTKRALAPTPEEIERNPRSASAHLRAARKLRDEGPAD